MPKFNDIKNAINKAEKLAKKSAESIGKKVKEIDTEKLMDSARYATNFVENSVENVKESIANFDSEKAKEGIANATANGLDAIRKHISDMSETGRAAEKALKSKAVEEELLQVEDCLKIMYLMMHSDGHVSSSEIEKFRNAEKELDTENEVNESMLIALCDVVIESSKGDQYIDYLIDEISRIIFTSRGKKSGTVSKKLLMWNLLAMAYSDGKYTDEEKRIIQTIAKDLCIDKNVIQEMELAIQTIMSISEAKEKSNEHLEENNERISNIMMGVRQLIGD